MRGVEKSSPPSNVSPDSQIPRGLAEAEEEYLQSTVRSRSMSKPLSVAAFSKRVRVTAVSIPDLYPGDRRNHTRRVGGGHGGPPLRRPAASQQSNTRPARDIVPFASVVAGRPRVAVPCVWVTEGILR